MSTPWFLIFLVFGAQWYLLRKRPNEEIKRYISHKFILGGGAKFLYGEKNSCPPPSKCHGAPLHAISAWHNIIQNKVHLSFLKGREAAKKCYFLSDPARPLRRGGGVKAVTLRKKNFF